MRRSRIWFVAFTAVIAVLGGAVGAAVAVSFPDVPNSNPFADDIDAITDAGIATGFPDGTYRPTNTVNRQQMAGFFHRGGSRAGYDSGQVDTVLANGNSADVATVVMHAGATGDSATGGFALLVGTINAFIPTETTCPCHFEISLRANGSQILERDGVVSNVAGDDGLGYGTATITAVVPVPKDAAITYSVAVQRDDANQADNGFYEGDLSVIYAPFAADGGQDLDG